MSEVQQMWIHPTPNAQVRTPRGFHLSPSTFFALLFVSLLIIAVPTLLILPQLNHREQTQTELEIPELLANCAFFYQRCPTSKLGVATPQTVAQLLTEINSPLDTIGLLTYSRTDKLDTLQLPPSQILTYIATEYNINPMLLLTLSEMDEHTVTKADKVNIKVEGSGEQNAWFAIKHQQMAKDLQTLATEMSLAPNSENEKTPIKTLTFGSSTTPQKATGNPSIASGVIAKYLAKKSSSPKDLEDKMTLFLTTYEQLFGMNPASTHTDVSGSPE